MTGSIHIDAFAAYGQPPPDQGSPQNSSEEAFLQDDPFSMLDDFDGLDDSLNAGDNAENGDNGLPKRKSRRPPSTAERRATHNAVERARRETLNGRFMDLAQALPSMANVKRPSKSIIVNKSLEFVKTSVAREQALVKENDALRTELNELRARLGMPAVAGAPKTAPKTTNAAPRRRQQSVASIASSASASASADSPVIGGGSPLSSANPFDVHSIMSASMGSIAESPVSNHDGSLGTPPITGFPMMDMNYMMALQMQHAQAQNMLKMSAGAPFGFVPNWQMGVPVSAAPDMSNNWLFG